MLNASTILDYDGLIPHFISFPYLDAGMKKHPTMRGKWEAISEDSRLAYHHFVNMLIQIHRWRGKPIFSNVSSAAFPRAIGCTYVTFQGLDWDSPVPEYTTAHQIIPQYILVMSVAWLLNREPFQELLTLRDMGIAQSTVGPLFTEFQGRNFRGQERITSRELLADDPLPEPLWRYMKWFSLEYAPQSPTFKLERA